MARHTESRHKSRVWRDHIEGWRLGGLSQRDYCARHGLALSTFQLWRRRLVTDGLSRGSGCVELVAIPKVLASESVVQNQLASIVVCVGPYRIEVADGARVGTLRCVIDALGTR